MHGSPSGRWRPVVSHWRKDMRSCSTTGKKSYSRFGDAQAAGRRTTLKNARVGERKVDEYLCQHCGQWHVGRTPFWINQETDRKYRADRAMSRLLELRARRLGGHHG